MTSLESNGIQGPFALTDSNIDREVTRTSAGVFTLDDTEDAVRFHVVFVGRSDFDLNNQLHVYVGTYKRFKFAYCSSARSAFEKECELFHDFEPPENLNHPARLPGSGWTCNRCGLFG
jgi:hypothetical protein